MVMLNAVVLVVTAVALQAVAFPVLETTEVELSARTEPSKPQPDPRARVRAKGKERWEKKIRQEADLQMHYPNTYKKSQAAIKKQQEEESKNNNGGNLKRRGIAGSPSFEDLDERDLIYLDEREFGDSDYEIDVGDFRDDSFLQVDTRGYWDGEDPEELD